MYFRLCIYSRIDKNEYIYGECMDGMVYVCAHKKTKLGETQKAGEFEFSHNLKISSNHIEKWHRNSFVGLTV